MGWRPLLCSFGKESSCPYPKNLPEVNTKRLISLAEAVSKQHNIECVAWLLLITLIQVNCSKGQVSGEKYKTYRPKILTGITVAAETSGEKAKEISTKRGFLFSPGIK